MKDEYVQLTEKEEMWAQMLIQVLENNHIPCTSLPVYGAGFALKTGMQDRLRIFVPASALPQATHWMEELFSAEAIPEDEETV